jgi:hypothetical protein
MFSFQKSTDMHNEPRQKYYALNNPSIQETLRIAKKYQYKVALMRVGSVGAFLSVSEPFLKPPYPQHFTSVVRTAKYVEAAFKKYNS